MIDAIRANAEMTVEHLAPLVGGEFGFDGKSVRWLDGYIEGLRSSGGLVDEAGENRLISVFGSYLGECIIRCHGGAWAEQEGQWCVAFDNRNCVYPFAKMRKQFENGPEESIAGFFEMIPVVFAGPIKVAERLPD